MVQAAAAGIMPNQFYDLTIGEIYVAIEGYQEREKQSLIGRISAILRAFGRKGNPYAGLNTKSEATGAQINRAAKDWIWRSE